MDSRYRGGVVPKLYDIVEDTRSGQVGTVTEIHRTTASVRVDEGIEQIDLASLHLIQRDR